MKRWWQFSRLRTARLMQVLAAVFVLVACLGVATARAEVSQEYEHSFEQVWSGTVRLLRVDRGFKVVEKDVATGYILFEFKDSPRSDRSYAASAELIRDRDAAGYPVVKLKFAIRGKSELPHDILHKHLAAKLVREYGAPSRPKPPKKKDGEGEGESSGDDGKGGDASKKDGKGGARESSRGRRG